MLSNTTPVVLIIVAMAACQPSYANALKVESLAVATSMTFQIYDLDPGDGYTASVSFLDDSKRWRMLTHGDNRPGLIESQWVYQDGVSWTNAFGFGSQTTSNGILNVGSGGSVLDASLLARTRIFDTNILADGYAAVSSTGDSLPTDIPSTFYNMLLAPGTGVRLTTNARVSLNLADECFLDCAFASAYVQLYATFSSMDLNGGYGTQNRRTLTSMLVRSLDASFQAAAVSNLSLAATEALTLSYENRLIEPMIGRVRVTAEAIGQSASVSNVPEPQSVLLLVTGLAVIGFAAMQRTTVRRPSRLSKWDTKFASALARLGSLLVPKGTGK